MTKPERTDAVYAALVKAAGDLRTVTYGELGDAAGIHHRHVRTRVGYIRDAVCRPRGLPWLSVLAVNAKTRRPGDSFLPSGAETDPDDLFWRGMAIQVFLTDWSGIPCEPPEERP